MSFSVGVFTQHLGDSESTNNKNRLFALEYDNWNIAWFENSYCRDSLFFGRRLHTYKKFHKKYDNWFAQANLYYGAVYGYGNESPINIKGVSPFLFPTIGVGYEVYSFEVGISPTPDNPAVIGMVKIGF